MIDPTKVCVLLPVHDVSGYRRDGFGEVFKHLYPMNFGRIVVCEQVSMKGNTTLPLFRDWVNGPGVSNVLMATFASPQKHFNKSRAVNLGFQLIHDDCEWVWIHDADILLDFERVLSQVDPVCSSVQPFHKVVRLTLDQTRQHLQGKKVVLPVETTKMVRVFGGGSVLLKADLFRTIRGMNEAFVGYGGEDEEFGERIKSVSSPQMLGGRGIHLYHRPVSKSVRRSTSAANHAALEASRNARMTDTFAMINHMESSLPHLKDPGLPGTALVVCYSYENELRHKATTNALERLVSLQPKPHIYLVHHKRPQDPILRPDLTSRLAGYQDLPCLPRHEGFFNKEGLWNWAVVNMLTDEDVLFFIDSDSWPKDISWAWRVTLAVRGRPWNTFWQPWSEFADTKDSRLGRTSLACRIVEESDWDNTKNPGLCVAMTRRLWNSIEGFPLSCPAGAGDTMLFTELSHGRFGAIYRHEFPYFEKSVRFLLDVDIAYLPSHMVHEHHGSAENRAYHMRHHLVQNYYPFEEMTVDENGLLAAVVPGNSFQTALKRRRELRSFHDLHTVLRESGCPRPVFPLFVEYQEAAGKDSYLKGRWPLFVSVREIMRNWDLMGPFLEVGPRAFPAITNAEYMDHTNRWLDSSNNLTRHDAAKLPWPYPDHFFKVVVALEVVEHLPEVARRPFFEEAARLSDFVVVSLPFNWTKGEADHCGIGELQYMKWAQANPIDYSVVGTSHQWCVMVFRSSDILARSITNESINIEPWYHLKMVSTTQCQTSGGMTIDLGPQNDMFYTMPDQVFNLPVWMRNRKRRLIYSLWHRGGDPTCQDIQLPTEMMSVLDCLEETVFTLLPETAKAIVLSWDVDWLKLAIDERLMCSMRRFQRNLSVVRFAGDGFFELPEANRRRLLGTVSGNSLLCIETEGKGFSPVVWGHTKSTQEVSMLSIVFHDGRHEDLLSALLAVGQDQFKTTEIVFVVELTVDNIDQLLNIVDCATNMGIDRFVFADSGPVTHEDKLGLLKVVREAQLMVEGEGIPVHGYEIAVRRFSE